MRLVLAVGLAVLGGIVAAAEPQTVSASSDVESRARALIRTVVAMVSRLDADLTDYSYFERLPSRVHNDRGLAASTSVIWCSAHAIYGSDGKLRGFHLSPGDTETRDRRARARKTVGPVEARKLLDEYRALFGEVGPVHVLAMSRAVENGLDVFTLLWTPAVHAIPLSSAYSGRMTIDASRGQLVLYYPSSVPSAPIATGAVLPLERLREIALSVFADTRPFSRGSIRQENLHVTLLPPSMPMHFRGPSLKPKPPNEALPVYQVWIADADYIDSRLGSYGDGVGIILDARDGGVLDYDHPSAPWRSLPPRPDAPSPWNRLKVWRVAGSSSAHPGRLAPVHGPQATGPGRPVVLVSGKDLILAVFDEVSGLVWRDQNGRRDFARPDAVLRADLRR